jgi:hypothetical protein
MNAPRIALFTANGYWHADMSEAADAESIRKLFSSCILVCPFASTRPAASVQAIIEQENPGHQVVIR